MQEYTLEKELNNRIEQHKENVLKMRIQKYYEDLYNTGVVIPIFMLEPPERMAKKGSRTVKEIGQTRI